MSLKKRMAESAGQKDERVIRCPACKRQWGQKIAEADLPHIRCLAMTCPGKPYDYTEQHRKRFEHSLKEATKKRGGMEPT